MPEIRSNPSSYSGVGFVSVILPLMNETKSFTETVNILLVDCGEDILEFLVIVCDRTKVESLNLAEQLQKELGERMLIIRQTLPFLGGALREGFQLAKGSHVLMMATDLETPPQNAKDLIRLAKQNPEAIVTASRWLRGGNFEGYSPLKYVLNYIFQKLFSVLYGTALTDMTYGYRVFPTPLVRSVRWEELRHAFLFESLAKPLKLGTRVIETPVIWRKRDEGESQNTFLQNFIYFRTGFKTFFSKKQDLLKP